jgi:DNA-binding transcriptional ArsR family regulator
VKYIVYRRIPMSGENMPAVKLSAQLASSAVQNEIESLARLAKALSHPARVSIVRLLHEKQACIGCDIVDEIGLAQSTTSEHLRILKSAGIITGEIERPRVCYSLNPAALEPLSHFLEEVAGAQPAQTRN